VGTITPTATALGGPGGNGSVGIRKSGTGTWVLTNDNVYTGETLVNEGTLIVNGDQSAATGLTTVAAGATLGGNGTLGGDLIADGIVAPGTSAGTLTVGGTYAQNAGATLAIQIGGLSAGQFDVLAVLGTAEAGVAAGDYNGNGFVDAADYTTWRDHLGDTGVAGEVLGDGTGADLLGTPDGTVDENDYLYWMAHFGESAAAGGAAELAGELAIDLISGFTPSMGNSFTVLTASSIVDNGLTLSGESAGFSLVVNSTSVVLMYAGAGSGSLAATAVPEPSSLLLAGLAVLGLTGVVRRRS
jgi:autotransporter-associated beta strand protein